MYVFPFIRIRYIKTITINTHIDCLNNSKCSVRDILLATKQGAFESVFGTCSVKMPKVGSMVEAREGHDGFGEVKVNQRDHPLAHTKEGLEFSHLLGTTKGCVIKLRVAIIRSGEKTGRGGAAKSFS